MSGIIVTIAAFTLSVLAATNLSASSLTRDAAIKQAVASNLELKVAALEIDRAKSKLKWAGRLSNPEIELSHSNDLIGQNDNEGGFELAFSQRFPVTARLMEEKEVRRRDVELAEIEFRIRQRQLAYEVDKAWILLRAARRSEVAAVGLIQVNAEVSQFLVKSADLGEASSLDVMQAALSGKMLEQELGAAKAASAEAAARLNHLMGTKPGTKIALREATPLPKSSPPTSLKMETVLKNRPDYSLLLAAKNLGDAQLDLAMSQRWDDLAVKVFLERERSVDEPSGLDRNTMVGVGVSIPLPLRDKNEAAIEEAELDIEKSRLQRSAKIFSIHSELQRSLKARLAAYKLALSASQGALPLARKNLEEFKKAQQNGQASLLQVQQAQAQLLQLEHSAVDLHEDFDLRDAEVRFIAGTYPIPMATYK